MSLLQSLLSLFALLVIVSANTEKVIFLAPDAIGLPASGPALENLHLTSLTPSVAKVRRSLPVSFEGEESWYLLQDLSEGQRYELRVCWAATQPTSFSIDTYNLTYVFDTPHLIQSLATFSEAQQGKAASPVQESGQPQDQSVLFLHIRSVADFFTTNKTLMQSPSPVDVDIILDPYFFNIFPQSLASTGVYITILAIAAWVISGAFWKRVFATLVPKHHRD